MQQTTQQNKKQGSPSLSKKVEQYSTVDNVYGKVPPQATEIESAVLGAILLEKDAFDVAARVLKPECFYVDAHKKVFNAMCQLAKNNMPIDSMTVAHQLASSAELDLVGGVFGITKLTNHVVSGAHIETHARIVFQKFLSRQLIRLSSELLGASYDETIDVFELIDHAERSINDIGMKNIDGSMVRIDSVLMQAMEKIQGWKDNNSDGITGIHSGFANLDKATRGWQGGDLIILAARPSVGKTAFALNLISAAASHPTDPVTVGVWSLEMKAVYLVLRMLSAKSELFLHRLQTGKLSEAEMASMMQKAVFELSKLNIFFDDNTKITLQSLSRKARRLKKENNLGLIVIDYLQLMQGDEKAGNREQEIAKVSRGLKELALELDVPVIALSQLSREMGSKGISWNFGPPISSIRESGAIEQDADVIMMLWGPGDAEIAEDNSLEGKRKVRIAKQRNGVLITEELNFKNEIQLFESVFGSGGIDGNWKPVPRETVNYTEPVKSSDSVQDEMPF